MAKTIPLTNSTKMATCDDEDYDYLMQWSWRLSSHGYAARTEYISPTKSKVIYMHDEVMKRAERDRSQKHAPN